MICAFEHVQGRGDGTACDSGENHKRAKALWVFLEIVVRMGAGLFAFGYLTRYAAF